MASFTGIPLIDALKWGEDEKSLGWIETIVDSADVLQSMPQKRITGRVWRQEVEGTLPNVQFRNVNETYSPSHGVNDFTNWGTAILGGELKVDIAVDSFDALDELEADEFEKHAKSAAMRYQWELINGTGANKGFKGLSSLITDGHGNLHDQGSDAALSYDELDEALLYFEHGDPSEMLMNKEIAMRFSHRARSGYTQFTLIDQGVDKLGKPVKRYNGIPIRVLRRGLNASGAVTQILPQTESGGAATSIYLVRYGKDAVTGLLGHGGAMSMKQLGESTEGPYRIGRMEFYPGVASFDPFSLVRFSRITNA